MPIFDPTHAGELLLWLAVLLALLLAARLLLPRIRALAAQKEPKPEEMLAKFHELRSRGVLDEAEFRTIRASLADDRRGELKGTDE